MDMKLVHGDEAKKGDYNTKAHFVFIFLNVKTGYKLNI